MSNRLHRSSACIQILWFQMIECAHKLYTLLNNIQIIMINLTIKEIKETHNMDGWNIIDIWIENHIRSDCKVRARSMKPIDV